MLTTTIPVVITQTNAIINCKIAPNIFFPFATTISLNVESAFSIIFEIKIVKYVIYEWRKINDRCYKRTRRERIY